MRDTQRVLNLPAPASDNEPARKADLNAAIQGLAWKDNVRVSTQGNVSLASPGAAINSVTMSVADRVLVRAQTSALENGIYIWNGAAVAMTRAEDANTATELTNAVVAVDSGTDAGVTFRQTQVGFVLGADPVVFSSFATAAPAASDTVAGLVELATQAEVDSGTDTARAVVPGTLAGWSGRKRKFSATFGDGSATQFDHVHNFGMREVQVEVFRNSGNYDTVVCEVSRTDTNTVRLNFGSAPTTNQFTVVILG